MNIFSAISEIFSGLWTSGKQATKEAKQATGFQYIRCLYFTGGRMWDLMGSYDKERAWVTPKNVNQSFKVTKVYYDGKGEPFIICFQQNHRTIDFMNPPRPMDPRRIQELTKQNEQAKADLENPDKKGVVIDSVSLAQFHIPGAQDLAQDAESLINRVDLRVIQGVSRVHVLMIVLIGLLVGWIIGAVMAGVGVLAITMGSFGGPA